MIGSARAIAAAHRVASERAARACEAAEATALILESKLGERAREAAEAARRALAEVQRAERLAAQVVAELGEGPSAPSQERPSPAPGEAAARAQLYPRSDRVDRLPLEAQP